MAGESWAKRVIEKALGLSVLKNDDGSAPSMYDLRIGMPDNPDVAIECVGAVDPNFTETFNVGPAKGPLSLQLKGDWRVEITPTARINDIRRSLQPLLEKLGGSGIHNVGVDDLECSGSAWHDTFTSLGITHAWCYRAEGSGAVYLDLQGIGGAVDEMGSSVPKWIGDFLEDPGRRDVLSKLESSGARACHVFVIAEFKGSNWPVWSYLTGDLDNIPGQAPDLPEPVTAVWIVPTFGRKGLYWDGSTWQVVQARGEGIDEP